MHASVNAPEHTWQIDSSQAMNWNVPLEPSSVRTSGSTLSVGFLQQLSNVAQVCVEAQETSMNVTCEFSKLMETLVNKAVPGSDPGINPNSEVDTTSHSGSMSPPLIKPRGGAEEPSKPGVKTPVPDFPPEIGDRAASQS
ncbi:hypothetical protein BT96DRAFT_996746 [Gymnopus androsaceus JB14]|uniref:Uncharacterized protein n=1 Tax=Gymnopus androsaceus JB14 TaxID=1447944 RepID=A0A6A4HDF0_9AGAR|nr:hypothetical protein BT96DRAFT_996746 [Gymnopus androsaceus JB14]